MKETAVLLINLGTPDSPSVKNVRSYLRQFLNDPRVIDIPWLLRKLLVNLIIVPFRAPKSARIYKKLWTEKGSPLLFHSMSAREKLQDALGENYQVFLAMRYKNPSIKRVLAEIQKENFRKLIVFPMFPHYASASIGSAHEEVMKITAKWWVIPELTFITHYFDHPDFIAAFAERGQQYPINEFDHVLFSYHGLPERQVDKTHENKPCEDFQCTEKIDEKNYFCYRAACYATTRLLASKLSVKPDQYTVAFQSRLDDKWLKPFSDEVIKSLALSGCKRLLVFSPAFTADCLETLIEIGDEYKELFSAHGGEKLQLVESLNDHPLWIRCMKNLVEGS